MDIVAVVYFKMNGLFWLWYHRENCSWTQQLLFTI